MHAKLSATIQGDNASCLGWGASAFCFTDVRYGFSSDTRLHVLQGLSHGTPVCAKTLPGPIWTALRGTLPIFNGQTFLKVAL